MGLKYLAKRYRIDDVSFKIYFYLVFGPRVCQKCISRITNNILFGGLLILIHKNHVHSKNNIIC